MRLNLCVIVSFFIASVFADSVEETIHDFFAFQSESKCEAWSKLFSKNGFKISDPKGSGQPITDLSVAVNNCNQNSDVFKKFRIEVIGKINVLHDGSGAAVNFQVNGTTKRDCQIAFSGIDIFEFDEERRVASLEGYYDFQIPAEQMNCKPVVVALRSIA